MQKEVGIVIAVKKSRVKSDFAPINFDFYLGHRKAGSNFSFISLARHPKAFQALDSLASKKTRRLGSARLTVHKSSASLSWQHFKPLSNVELPHLSQAELLVHKAIADHLRDNYPKHMIWDARGPSSDFNKAQMEHMGLPIGEGFSISRYARTLTRHVGRLSKAHSAK